MKITNVKNSVFDLPDVTHRVKVLAPGSGPNRSWVSRPHSQSNGHRHVLHVLTDEGVVGVFTVGDAWHTTMVEGLLEQS